MVLIAVSGFVIAGLVIDKKESWSRYIVRRAFRIFSAYWIAFAFALTVLPLAIETLRYEPWSHDPNFGYNELLASWLRAMREHFAAQAVLHLTLFQGLIPDSVWPATGTAVLGPSWSLTLEWQFYLIAPTLIWLLRNERWRVPTAALIAALALAFKKNAFGQFNLPTFFPGAGYVFLVGIGSRLAFGSLERVSVSAALPIAAAGMALLFPDLAWLAIWAGVLAFLLCGEGWRCGADGVIGGLMRGARSYSVYVLHLPLMQFLTWVIVTHHRFTQNALCVVLLAVVIPATLARISHRSNFREAAFD
jgi:peptidoglycan/LPS O-acetylase OafA/YrhL